MTNVDSKRTSGLLGVAGIALALLAGAASRSRAAEAALTPTPVKTSAADEYAPAADGPWFSWTESSHDHPNRSNVFVRRGSGSKIRVNAAGTHGAGGGLDGDILVYYEHRGNYAGDVRKFNLRTHRRSNFPSRVSTRWDEYHPTISGPWVLFTRYNSSRNTTKVLLYDTRSSQLRTLGADHGHRFVYSGQVNGDFATWGRVRPGGQDVYLYRISTKTTTTIPRPVFAQYNPVVTGNGTVYFERSGNGCGAAVSLVRYPLGGPATVLYTYPDGIDGGYGYVDEKEDGSLDWLFGQVSCRTGRWDVYRVSDSHSVSVLKSGSGTGTVSSDPAGIDCGAACEAIFHGGTPVTLNASAEAGSVFVGWSDPACGANPTCEVTVEDDVSLTATFDPSP